MVEILIIPVTYFSISVPEFILNFTNVHEVSVPTLKTGGQQQQQTANLTTNNPNKIRLYKQSDHRDAIQLFYSPQSRSQV